MIAAPLLLAPIVSLVQAQVHTPQLIRVDDTAKPHTRFLGLGVEFDPYVRTPAPDRWQTMMSRLAYMNPGFLRVMSSATDYCSGFDVSGNPIYRWKTNPNDPELRRVLDVLDFAQAHNIQVYLGEWQAPGSLGIHSPADPRWANMIADFLQYLTRTQHYTVVRHYIMMNEPNGNWMWKDPDMNAWSSGVRGLRHELDVRNLQTVILSGPDTSGGQDWFDRSTRELHTTFGSWEEHIYAKDELIARGGLEAELIADRKIIMTNDPHGAEKERFVAESGLVTGKNEALDQQPRVYNFEYGVGMADYVVQVARAGWDGADAWDLDDAMHDNDKGSPKIWGFWDSSNDTGMRPRPWFFIWTVLSRTLPAGAEILPVATDGGSRVRVTAARWHSTHSMQWTIVLVNDHDDPADLNVRLPSQQQWHILRYFAGEQKTDALGLPQETQVIANSSGQQAISMPSRGVIVLTTEWANDAPK